MNTHGKENSRPNYIGQVSEKDLISKKVGQEHERKQSHAAFAKEKPSQQDQYSSSQPQATLPILSSSAIVRKAKEKTQHENPAGQGQEDIVSEVDALLLKEKRQDTVSCLHQGCPKEEPHIVSQTIASVEKTFHCHEGKCCSDTAG